MIILRSIRSLSLALCAVGVLALPAAAQQRIQIGDLIQRIDRLETEVTRLRVSSGGGGGDLARLDQIEQELRRLTGIIERLDYDNRRASSASDKRLDGFDQRLSAIENSGSRTSSRPPVTTDSSFAKANPSPLTSDGTGPTVFGPSFDPAVPYQPQAAFQPQPDLTQSQQPLAAQPFVPQSSPGGFQSADALYDEGIRLLNIGSFDQAGAQFEDLIAAHPQDAKAGQAQYWLGDMHFKLGRYEQAASAFLDSFRNWPEGAKAPDSLLKLGMTLANIGKTEEACLSFKQVSARYPSASPSLLRRADIESQRYRCG